MYTDAKTTTTSPSQRSFSNTATEPRETSSHFREQIYELFKRAKLSTEAYQNAFLYKLFNTPTNLRHLLYQAFHDMDTTGLFSQGAIDKVFPHTVDRHSTVLGNLPSTEKLSILTRSSPELVKSILQQLPAESQMYLLVQIAKVNHLGTFSNLLDMLNFVSLFKN
jgi:hypothetical protein